MADLVKRLIFEIDEAAYISEPIDLQAWQLLRTEIERLRRIEKSADDVCSDLACWVGDAESICRWSALYEALGGDSRE